LFHAIDLACYASQLAWAGMVRANTCRQKIFLTHTPGIEKTRKRKVWGYLSLSVQLAPAVGFAPGNSCDALDDGVRKLAELCVSRGVKELCLSECSDKYTRQVYNMNVKIVQVIYTTRVSKQMRQAPHYITEKLLGWAREVEIFGMQAVRRHKSYHDEPLKGPRVGERSIRLNKQWRAIYCEKTNGSALIYILEMTPHDYEK
jgi:proteic killer suppression protein